MAITVDESYRKIAARYVRKQAKRLARRMQGVRTAEDVESIHQARIASRRLRAALRMFGDCFAAKKSKRWTKHIRRITAEMGAARDRDVQILFLYGILRSLTDKACYPGVARLLVRSEKQRERLQPAVVAAADRLQAAGVLKQMRGEAKRILDGADSKQPESPGAAVFEQVEPHIFRRLDRLLRYEDCLADPDDKPRHHKMRIAAKRLRYTLEIAGPLFEGELDGTLAAVKELQSRLGVIHDCDVWSDELDRFAKSERRRIRKLFGRGGPFARLEAGIEYLRQDRLQCRRQTFIDLGQYWAELHRQGRWEKLAGIVQSRAAASGGRRTTRGLSRFSRRENGTVPLADAEPTRVEIGS